MSNPARKRVTESHNRSRITNGTQLLPGIDGRSVWARLFRDRFDALVQHAGGPDRITEPEHSLARRAAALETELVHLEAAMAHERLHDRVPDRETLDLYSRLSGTQRRMLDSLGIRPKEFDTDLTLHEYTASRGTAGGTP